MSESHRVVPSPNDWLRTSIRKKNASLSWVAKLVGCSPPQVSRWFSSVEAVPLEHLLCVAQTLCPQDHDYICLIKHCEELKKALCKSCKRLEEVLAIDFDLFTLVEKTLSEFVRLVEFNEYQLAHLYLHHLSAARFAIRLITEAAATDFLYPLIPRDTAGMLRHPMNHVIGQVLLLAERLGKNHQAYDRMSDFRNSALTHLRAVTLRPFRKGSSLGVTGQFSFYFLSRYGNPEDQAAVLDLLSRTGLRKELLIRRLIYSGVIQANDPNSEERYLYELRQDSAFALMSLQFDAFHYGDIDLDEQAQIPQGIRSYDRAIYHIIRHLSNPGMYPHIQEVESFKLLRLTELVDLVTLPDPGLFARLKRLVLQDGLLEAPPLSMRKQLAEWLDRMVHEQR